MERGSKISKFDSASLFSGWHDPFGLQALREFCQILFESTFVLNPIFSDSPSFFPYILDSCNKRAKAPKEKRNEIVP